MEPSLLNHIYYPSDLRKLHRNQLPQLAAELRTFIIEAVATKEGHLGASLGAVELTIALHYFFNTPTDKIVWDVGHQAYGHKLLTGRRPQFDTNRQLHGLSGFPKREESEYDTFGTGHSSTSISAALGMAISAKLRGDKKHQHLAVIGDASIASGMAFEALNHAGDSQTNLWVILNDNTMGIDPSVGALKNYLTKTKVGAANDQENIFTALNFHYSGPVDGHDFTAIFDAFKDLQKLKGPKFLHLVTKKGKGLQKAEEDQVAYHAPGKFDKVTGERVRTSEKNLPPKYQDVFGLTLLELARKNKKIVGITPAMPTGSSLKYMMHEFPERAFDVGIAEQHAVTLAAGMATEDNIVFCTIYSTFLQRAYDQVIHDVALQNLPVIFCIDRAGLVGEDGPTHHGVFDLAYLRCIPNLIITAPSNEIELRNLLYTASLGLDHPIAIRYPRGRGTIVNWKKPFQKLQIGTGKRIKKGKTLAILSVGTILENVLEGLENLAEVDKENIGVYDLRFIKPIDEDLLQQVFQTYQNLITIEDASIKGGFGDEVLSQAQKYNYRGSITKLGIPDKFIPHGTVEELHEIAGISSAKIKASIKNILTRKK